MYTPGAEKRENETGIQMDFFLCLQLCTTNVTQLT